MPSKASNNPTPYIPSADEYGSTRTTHTYYPAGIPMKYLPAVNNFSPSSFFTYNDNIRQPVANSNFKFVPQGQTQLGMPYSLPRLYPPTWSQPTISLPAEAFGSNNQVSTMPTFTYYPAGISRQAPQIPNNPLPCCSCPNHIRQLVPKLNFTYNNYQLAPQLQSQLMPYSVPQLPPAVLPQNTVSLPAEDFSPLKQVKEANVGKISSVHQLLN